MAPTTKYAEQTVEQLQNELQSRQLDSDGEKSQLVERLEADDAKKGQQNSDASGAAEPSKSETPEKAAEISPAPQKDPQALAIAHLERKLRRAKKFADDQATLDYLERQIARVRKFGLDTTTELARELGLGKGPETAVPTRSVRSRTARKSNKNARGN